MLLVILWHCDQKTQPVCSLLSENLLIIFVAQNKSTLRDYSMYWESIYTLKKQTEKWKTHLSLIIGFFLPNYTSFLQRSDSFYINLDTKHLNPTTLTGSKASVSIGLHSSRHRPKEFLGKQSNWPHLN